LQQVRRKSKYVISIKRATFYHEYPDTSQDPASVPKLFPDLSISLAPASDGQTAGSGLAVLSTASVARTTFLKILSGQYICLPPGARKYPILTDTQRSPQQAIQYVGFDAERGSSVGGSSLRGSYLSARYESRREETDFSVRDYLIGNTELNALEERPADVEAKLQTLDSVAGQLRLGDLLDMPVSNLSNGQTRRARIAKALMEKPEVLLLDGLFMGLDPRARSMVMEVLGQVSETRSTKVVLSLSPEDVCPEWVENVLITDEDMAVFAKITREDLTKRIGQANPYGKKTSLRAVIQSCRPSAETGEATEHGLQANADRPPLGEPIIEMRGVRVSYGSNTVLGNWTQDIDGCATEGLSWDLRRGQRYGIFGPNGSGKTTMLSLITSDHPQAYSLPIKIFGRSRLPEPGQPGISLFDLQRRIGHSSPEVHSFFPKKLSVRQALESAWADAPLARPELTHDRDQRVTAFLRWFEAELKPGEFGLTPLEKLERHYISRVQGSTELAIEALSELQFDEADIAWAEQVCFGELNFGAQRLVLFLRAIIASPDLIILDEAFSGLDAKVREKAFLFLERGEKMFIEKGVQDTTKVRSSALVEFKYLSFEGMSDQQALVVISHSRADVPDCVREWICLPEPGGRRAPRMGTLEQSLEVNPKGWDAIWASDEK
jgi:ABC-type molybdenum transport system ATPase subunit/photorepair protein PhrA